METAVLLSKFETIDNTVDSVEFVGNPEDTQSEVLAGIAEVIEEPQSDSERIRAKRCSDFAATAIICAGCPMLQFCESKTEAPGAAVNQVTTVERFDSLDVDETDIEIPVSEKVLRQSVRTPGATKEVVTELTGSMPEIVTETIRPTYLEELLDDSKPFISARNLVVQEPSERQDIQPTVIQASHVDSISGTDDGFDVMRRPEIILPESEFVVTFKVDKTPIEVISVPPIVAMPVAVVAQTGHTSPPEIQLESLVAPVVQAEIVFDYSTVPESELLIYPDTILETHEIQPHVSTIEVIEPPELVQYVNIPTQRYESSFDMAAKSEDLLPLVESIEHIDVAVFCEPIIATIFEQPSGVIAAMDAEIQEIQSTSIILVSETESEPETFEITDSEDKVEEAVIEAINHVVEMSVSVAKSDLPDMTMEVETLVDCDTTEFQLQQPAHSLDGEFYDRGDSQSISDETVDAYSEVFAKPLIDSDSIDPEFSPLGTAQTHRFSAQTVRRLALQALSGLLVNLGGQRAVV